MRMAKLTLYYHQSGDTRLSFVRAVTDILGVKPKYTGVPKCAYIIDFATVNREGNIEVDERTDSSKLTRLMQKLMERGYMTEQSGEGWEEEPPVQPEEIVNAVVDEQATEQATEAEQVAASEPIGTTFSVPRDIFTDLGLENLKKLLWAKNELICQALDISSTDIEVTDEAVSFPWFGELNADEVKHISQFISGLCEFANTSKRITSRQHREDNPKYAMRTWAIRLGFTGPEHKELRKFLMKRLPGDAAWRFGKPDNVQPLEPRFPISVQVSAQ
jgi:hypothetical protein